MSFYRHNNTGKYFIVLESQLERIPTEPNRGDDIVQEFRKEVSETVGINSENANDFFPISRNYYETDKGAGEAPLTTVPEFQKTLLKTIDSEEAKTSLETTSNSNMLGFRIKKGKLALNPEDPSWPDLLNQLSKNPQESKINRSVDNLLSSNNINSPSKPFFNPQDYNENKVILGSIQYKNLGEHAPRKYPDVVEANLQENQITIEEMKKVGLNLLLAASGLDLLAVSIENDNPNAQSIVEDGDKITFGSFKPTTVLKSVKPKYQNTDNNDSAFDNSNLVTSHGSPNNPIRPYTGTREQISSPVLFAKIVTISHALNQIIQRFSLTGRGLGDHLANGTSRDRQKLLGSNLANAGAENTANTLDPFDTPPLTNDFYQSVQAGFKQFFGLADNFNSQNGSPSQEHAGKNPKMYGYISTFVRKLNVAIKQLNLSQQPTSLPVTTGGASSTLNTNSIPNEELVESLKSNFAIKFIKVLSIIGDKALIILHTQQQVPVQGIDGYVSDIDSVEELISPNDARFDPGILVIKHRLDTNHGGLAYANTTLESMLLVPRGILEANAALVESSDFPAGNALVELVKTNKVITSAQNDRISQADVKSMEDYLEMDYVPFYFHDLRTNEIISFHAFLESVSDNLSAEFNETEGYGRTGVVPVYKNTKRTINFTFKILATSQDDHEQMWYKVNRLAACLYPQYSEGRLLNYQGSKFIQPFSQVFAASPLMRIRFGDLWKSNYSKLAVARLFGLAGLADGERSTFELASTRVVSVRPQPNRISQQQQQLEASTEAPRPLQVGDQVEIRPKGSKHRWAAASRDNNYMGNPAATSEAQARGQLTGEYIRAANLFLYIPSNSAYVTGEIVEIHPSSRRTGFNYYVRVTNANTGASGQLGGVITNGGNTRARDINNIIQYSKDPTGWVICVNPGCLNRVVQIIREPPPPQQQIETVNNSIPDFFKCDGDDPNPIMKAFCSTEGKGLACVIRSMNLDGLTEVPWSVERFDGRAPQLLTVAMEITPIHDINPGLDNKGFMTAPIWPTGTIVNNIMGNNESSNEGLEKFNQSRSKYLFPSTNKLGA